MQLKAFLPPPTRRGLCLIDPSYENKEDYNSVLKTLGEAIERFANGVYFNLVSHYSTTRRQLL
jgi:23S rRNA (adenine2030-N6)-methyltransferase